MHFDRLNKTILYSVKIYQSDGENVIERLTDFDLDFKHMALPTRNV